MDWTAEKRALHSLVGDLSTPLYVYLIRLGSSNPICILFISIYLSRFIFVILVYEGKALDEILCRSIDIVGA